METMKDMPGLISREIIDRDESGVFIREIWDTTVEGCPFVVMKTDGCFEKNEDAVEVQKVIYLPTYVTIGNSQ